MSERAGATPSGPSESARTESSTRAREDGVTGAGVLANNVSILIKNVVAGAVSQLKDAGVPSPAADAQLLVAHALGVERRELTHRIVMGQSISDDELKRLGALLAQRCARVPLQHLTGSTGFRGIELAVGPGVFVPRAETELAAGLAVEAASTLPDPLVVDLCTGSGAIALSVADEVPTARVVAVELDPQAVAWARKNVERLGLGSRVDLRAGDAIRSDSTVLADLAGAVDVLVANPPYIPPDAEPVEPEVRDHDPAIALYGGGDDGLATARGVIAAAANLLRDGGVFIMEHGEAQGPSTRALMGAGWEQVTTQRDLAGRDRALVAVRATNAPTQG